MAIDELTKNFLAPISVLVAGIIMTTFIGVVLNNNKDIMMKLTEISNNQIRMETANLKTNSDIITNELDIDKLTNNQLMNYTRINALDKRVTVLETRRD